MSASAWQIETFGTEGEPLVIIDGFSADPDALVERARSRPFQPLGPHYPGVRAPADPDYLGERMALLREILSEVFGMVRGASLVECNYSLVTTQPDDLRLIQRLPHLDSTDPGRVALLHYLCGPEQGGTAFYRHRATGIEQVTQDRWQGYTTALEAEIAAQGEPDKVYVTGDTPLFAQIGKVDAGFNRMVIYRGLRLHSGIIPPSLTLTPEVDRGRLTINTFLQARP